jgi:hypothetical protein
MFTLPTLLVFLGGLLAGVIAALKVIAPKTANTVDDAVLAAAEKVEGVVETLEQK